jgi:hypothetical protein
VYTLWINGRTDILNIFIFGRVRRCELTRAISL